MTIDDRAGELAEEKGELARNKENAALKKRDAALDEMEKKGRLAKETVQEGPGGSRKRAGILIGVQ